VHCGRHGAVAGTCPGGFATGAGLVVADAAGLPLCAGACDLALAMHMLYHVPDQEAVVRELRRVTRPGGQVLVGLNGSDHLRELRELINEELPAAGRRAGPAGGAAPVVSERLNLDGGHQLLAGVFTSVTRHDFTAELLLPGPEPVEDYVRSMIITQELPEPERLVAAVASRIPAGRDGVFRVRTHSGCLVCS
jgi:SAM-dependent methyltransferase